jgi:cell wall-associated NlpC family hydrolase
VDKQEKLDALRDGSWRDRVVQEALTWKFTPYQHKGRIKGVGVDCGGLLYEVYNPWLGPFKPFPDDYAPDWAVHKESNELYLDFILPYVTEQGAPVRGGFSLFHYGRNYSHAAIYMGGDKFMHAFGRNTAGMVKESGMAFFRNKGGALREMKHFDVSTQWLSSLSL